MLFARTLITAALVLAPMISANPLPASDNDLAAREALGETGEGLDLLAERGSKDYHCPATNNGPDRNYTAHRYTAGQAKAALSKAKSFQQGKGEAWRPARDEYPHYFGNAEKLPFNCGRQKAEFPIQTDGKVFSPPTGDVARIPDRLVYEYVWVKGKKGEKGKKLQVKICGVMRHGPGRDFLNCPEK